MLVPVILCGGSGTRLWPLSRSSYPKQFVNLGKGRTLFKETVKRAVSVASDGVVPYVVTSETQRFYASANLKECSQTAQIIVEPFAKNTAPAIAAAAVSSLKQSKDATVLILPSDHVIRDSEAFRKAVKTGYELAKEGFLVTFGVKPTAPETAYGYIKKGLRIDNFAFHVEKFVEKPNSQVALDFYQSNEYFWNSGIFIFRADVYLNELSKYAPEILTAVNKSLENASCRDEIITLDSESFALSPEISIDYAVMEKTSRAVVCPLGSSWSDLGSWTAFYEEGDKDNNGNVTEGDICAIDTQGCYLHSKRLLTTIGISNMAVVETSDAVLVAPLNRSQDVRKLVQELKKKRRQEVETNSLVYRPWGSYESLTKGDRFQVKRIVVSPGEELSLQKHHHRAEHWIIVQGSAEVTQGDRTLFLTENQSTYISVGEIHRLKNPGKIPLVVIEVQSGSYLGEDDIVRLEDKYKRA